MSCVGAGDHTADLVSTPKTTRRTRKSPRKTYMLRIRMTEEQRTILEAAALKAGLDVSSWVRAVALAAAGQDST